jgi:hypothetical protein
MLAVTGGRRTLSKLDRPVVWIAAPPKVPADVQERLHGNADVVPQIAQVGAHMNPLTSNTSAVTTAVALDAYSTTIIQRSKRVSGGRWQMISLFL